MIWKDVFGNTKKVIPQGLHKNTKQKKLVYFEDTRNVTEAIAREKQIKGWTRMKKVDLIESMNPKWENLSRKWSEDSDS